MTNEHNVPQENLETYAYLYTIENALRELIINKLTETDGPRWYKNRLPGDVLKKYREGLQYEKNTKWTQLVLLHPIYYLDFADLKKIIERNDVWRDAFEPLFKRKDVLASTLSELEPIRNKIAHNRKVTSQDLEIIKAAYTKLSEAIGKDYFHSLSNICTCAPSIRDRLVQLADEIDCLFNACINCGCVESLETWHSLCKEWWFDETYLSARLDEIFEFFATMKKYAAIPRTRGCGYELKKWVRQHDVETKYVHVKKALAGLMEVP